MLAFDRMITQPSIFFRKAVVGWVHRLLFFEQNFGQKIKRFSFNCNVDVIVPGVQLMDALNASSRETHSDKETVGICAHRTINNHLSKSLVGSKVRMMLKLRQSTEPLRILMWYLKQTIVKLNRPVGPVCTEALCEIIYSFIRH